MDDKARRAARYTHPGVQDYPHLGIVQRDMRPVDSQCAGPQRRHMGADRLRRAKQQQRLIDEMRPQIVPDARPCPAIFAPAIARHRAKAVEMRFEMHNRPDRAGFDRGAHGQEIAVPPPIVKNRQYPPALARQIDKRSCLRQVERKRFFHHDMAATFQRLPCQIGVRGVGRGNHHQIDRRVG